MAQIEADKRRFIRAPHDVSVWHKPDSSGALNLSVLNLSVLNLSVLN